MPRFRGPFIMSKCLVAMQPTVFPWAGYFNLMTQADNFIFSDDLQLEKGSWQTRNRLIISGRVAWVGLPIKYISEKQTIIETEVTIDAKWRDSFARQFSINYGKHQYYGDSREVVDFFLLQRTASLAELNEAVICFIAEKLKIFPTIHRASALRIPGVRSEKLIAFCDYFSAEEYLSPVGSADYLAEDRFAERSQAKLRFQNYSPQPYSQKNTSQFVSHLSILDVIANIGWDKTRQYVVYGIA